MTVYSFAHHLSDDNRTAFLHNSLSVHVAHNQLPVELCMVRVGQVTHVCEKHRGASADNHNLAGMKCIYCSS